MSTIAVTNLKHESASGNNITLNSSGHVSTLDRVIVNGATINTNANWGVYINPKSGGAVGDLTITDPTGNFGRLNIDSAGRVTMPYQPAFHAVSTSIKTITGSAFIFDSAYFNIGGHYNTSNGRFTAPVAGVYFLEMSFLTENTNTNTIDLRFFKNGGQTQIATTYHANYVSNHRHGYMIGMAYLNANDYITVQTQGGASNGNLYGDNNEVGGKGHTSFRGYLIG